MRHLLVSDFHNGPGWAWLKIHAKEFDDVFYGGDFISENEFCLPAEKLIAARSEYLASFPVPFYACTGNHDWSPAITDLGLGYWYTRLTEQHPHLHGHGDHVLSDGWALQISDYAEDLVVTGNYSGPKTILLTHVPPSGPCAVQLGGCDFGDPQFARDISHSGPAVVCCGHTHQPRRHIFRQGSSLVLNPGVNTEPGESPNYIMITTTADGYGTVVFCGDGKRGEIAKI